MITDWLASTQNEIDAMFEKEPNIKGVPELSDLINILEYIKKRERREQKTKQESNGLISDIDGKLEMAQKHLEEYCSTRDSEFLQMSWDLVTHAQKYIGIAESQNINTSRQIKMLQNLSQKIVEVR